ncbi:HET-domain-containing protein [Microthyrium microscopicum]|uniref:HET-domain-containing protein n=1 Tax=Microthyrium microscopicum TaxID=703497 RepID=A0A6A6U4P3_9PEZI|nr:HET-domain-containing protein [Microthyrium microscopicum]
MDFQKLVNPDEQKRKHTQGSIRSHRPTFKLGEVIASAKAGCESCHFLGLLVKGTREEKALSNSDKIVCAWDGWTWRLECFDETNTQYTAFQLFYPAGATIRIQGMPQSRPLCGITSSPSTLDQAYSWMDHCDRSHTACGTGRNVPLPLRLIDVTSLQVGSVEGVKLVPTAGKFGAYACLSHCWGQAKIQAKTTSDTIQQFQILISWNLLPKNFQDAIVMARRFGLKYIWIDSLCIIQDSKSEWQKESAKMAEIYRNSFVTIAAVASSDSLSGCFQVSTPDKCLMIKPKKDRQIYIGARRCDLGDGSLYDDRKLPTEKLTPLFSRAWVYQERRLSRRILYCNRGEMSFECSEQVCCECQNTGLPPHNPSQGLQTKPEYAKETIHALFRRWPRTITDYSRLRLSYPSDKLPALSGCAQDLMSITGDKYLAGLWEDSLQANLLWYVNRSESSFRPRLYRAPSWSWASVDALDGISFAPQLDGSSILHKAFKHESAGCSLVGEDTTGAVSYGYIRLRTQLRTVLVRSICFYCRRRSQRYHILTTSGNANATVQSLESCFQANSTSVSPNSSSGFQRLDLRGGSCVLYLDTSTFITDNDLNFVPNQHRGFRTCMLTSIYLLYVKTVKAQKGILQKGLIPATCNSYFLALRRLRSKQNCYARIGLVEIGHPSISNGTEWFDTVWPQELMPESTIILE